MNGIIACVLVGLVATAVMTAFLYLVHGLKVANGDMLRAVGSLITANPDSFLKVGVAAHFALGVIFAFLYTLLINFLRVESLDSLLVVGPATGFIHGLVVSFGLVIFVAEHHPLPQFQRVGFAVALVHLVAHIIYGVIIALGVWWFHIRFLHS